MDFSKYHFVYNAAAHFAAMDKYPDGIVPEMSKNGTEGFGALCWALAEMSVQGELVRRDMGHDKGEMLREEHLRLHLKMRDLPAARKIIMDALIAGLGDGSDEEIDEVLAEIKKKAETE